MSDLQTRARSVKNIIDQAIRENRTGEKLLYFYSTVLVLVGCAALTRSSSGTAQSRSSTTPRRVRDSEISRAVTAVHSRRVQSERAASGDQNRTARSASRRPSSISATKLSPNSISTSQSHGSIFSALSSSANVWTNCLSFVLWERRLSSGGRSARPHYRYASR